MAVTGHALNQLLQQMDRTFSNVTGQSVSFIDQEGHYQGPLRLDVFTGFCRRVISSEKGAQHFLFNTLSLLMRTAYREGAPQTADLICDLADLLRRAYYYKDSICTLAEEMQCARQYLTLQSQRLGPGFSFEVGDVSACGQLMIPVLTIQPLVENAILHGAGEDEHPLHVKVSATAEDGKLVISVSDNGAGIPEEVLEKLRDHQAGGSGVQNVTERLKLFFGPAAGWAAASPCWGTVRCCWRRWPTASPSRFSSGMPRERTP